MKITSYKLALPSLLVSFALAGSLSCGAQSQKASHVPNSTKRYDSEAPSASDDAQSKSPDGESLFTDDEPALGDFRKAKIARLFREIGDDRLELKLSREPSGAAIESVQGTSNPQVDGETPQASPKSKTCKQVCRISKKICDNAELICELANDLGGDPWALDRCDSAKASCQEATKRCASCVKAE